MLSVALASRMLAGSLVSVLLLGLAPWGLEGAQCAIFTGMRLVFGDILISFGVVWYSGMRKWYAGF